MTCWEKCHPAVQDLPLHVDLGATHATARNSLKGEHNLNYSQDMTRVALAGTLAIALAGCDAADSVMSAVGGTDMGTSPDACFNAAVEKLGADAKVSDISTIFSAGPDVDPSATDPAGTVISCMIYYQNPEDPKKLLGITYAGAVGSFSEPAPVEVTVSGDASEFNLEDNIVALSDVNAAGVAEFLKANQEKLDERYSKHAVTMVQLMPPGRASDEFSIRVQVDGRLKSNDVKDDGFAILALDGTTAKIDQLVD